MNDFPRRNKIWLNTPAELAIRKAMEEVEKLPASENLTDAVVKLEEARNLVADFIDGHRNHKYYTCKDCGFRFVLVDNANHTEKEIFNSFGIFHTNPTLQIPCRKELIEITEQEFIKLTFDV